MKNIYIILFACFLPVQIVFGQVKATDPIPDNLKQLIIYDIGSAINQFKTQLCPQFNDSISYFDWAHNLKQPGSTLLYPGLNPKFGPFFSYNFEIKRWPEDKPYINFFLVIKKTNIMTRERDVTDE